MRLAIVICFRDEARYLPRLFSSLSAQTEPADEILLVDDGSNDESAEIARAFAAETSYAQFVLRERTTSEGPDHVDPRDRLAAAPELQGFRFGVGLLGSEWDVVAKMDGDLILPSTLFAEIRKALSSEPTLGIVGSYLSVRGPGGLTREHNPAHHVRGPNKFYRRACFREISPLPAYLGWDTIDELRAQRHGWDSHPIEVSSGDVEHLRPTGLYDGRLRAYRRWGRCAWGYGAHPLAVIAGTFRRAWSRPYGLGAASYLAGWLGAAAQRAPRAERDTRDFCQREEKLRLRSEIKVRLKYGVRAVRSVRAPDSD
jgi:biofilm PGA synthesis N-glycosyltransferase PgaC